MTRPGPEPTVGQFSCHAHTVFPDEFPSAVASTGGKPEDARKYGPVGGAKSDDGRIRLELPDGLGGKLNGDQTQGGPS
jgi:hypothetical protein